MQAPPARNVEVIIKLGATGEIEHVPYPEEESKTEHEFYIICAALSVRSCLLADIMHTVHAHACVMCFLTACLYIAQASVLRPTGAVIRQLPLLRCGST